MTTMQFPYPPTEWRDRGCWPGSWISVAGAEQRPLVAAYRRRFNLIEATDVELLISADERYELFLDGQRIGRGPGRGEPRMWPVVAQRIQLSAGAHVLVARVWTLGGLAPFAQLSSRHGFLLAAPGQLDEQLATGIAAWEGRILDGWNFASSPITWGTGAVTTIDGTRRDWAVEHGGGEGWLPVIVTERARSAITPIGWDSHGHLLTPAWLPPMHEAQVAAGFIRHLAALPVASWGQDGMRLETAADLPADYSAWQAFLDGTPLQVAAGECRRVLIDLGDYQCAWPELVVSGGAGAGLTLRWAEACYLTPDGPEKGHRGEILGKFFRGSGDIFLPDGGSQRSFAPQWWRAGRYVEMQIRVGAQPLVLERLVLTGTSYPLNVESSFACSDPRLETAAKPMVHTLRQCMHETYVDCPYYEQLMYIGDTRLEVLTTYALSGDDRLPRAALRLFDNSRRAGDSGLTCSRWPSREPQSIPTFSLWWVAMVYDFAQWRDDPAFVRSLLPGARAVIDVFISFIGDHGLLQSPPGWNFTDWTLGWRRWQGAVAPCAGVPPEGHSGCSAVLGWQLVHVLGMFAELEDLVGEAGRADFARRTAATLAAHTDAAFWNEARGLWADTAAHDCWSEHAQCLALLSGFAPSDHARRAAAALLNDPQLERATIYFSHYLFAAYRQIGAMPQMLARMQPWFGLNELGLGTTPEEPEPARSDCHAWGAHPLWHFRTGILGISPASAGFHRVRIEPQLGDLTSAVGSVCHPRGMVSAEFTRQGRDLAWCIGLPEGTSGVLCLGGHEIPLMAGISRGVAIDGHIVK